MSELATSRTGLLSHHVEQGRYWLENAANGENDVALSYAALELRLATERLAAHYWMQLLGRRPEAADIEDLRSFKRIENRIYELGGHQKQINGHFEFMQIVLNLLKTGLILVRPDLGQLASYWSQCSELCHIGWTLTSGIPGLCESTFNQLRSMHESLAAQAASVASWPIIPAGGPFAELRDRFVAGYAVADDIKAFLEAHGAWARVEYKDGQPARFLGEAIPPKTESG